MKYSINMQIVSASKSTNIKRAGNKIFFRNSAKYFLNIFKFSLILFFNKNNCLFDFYREQR